MLYFAYGSNMDPRQMARRCPGATAIGAALLEDHRLVFTWDSHVWEGGVGTVIPEPGASTWGVLWDCTGEHLASLDRYERVADRIYTRETATVLHDGAPAEALIYVATDTRAKRPSKRYMRALVEGARAHGLPPDYVAELEAVLG